MMRSYEGFLEVAPDSCLVLGPQGSGKGTQAKRIAAEYGDPARLDRRHVPRGDRRRDASSASRCEPILARGDLVPDELTVALIRERLAEPTRARLRARRLPAQPWRRRRRSTRCSTRSAGSSTPSSSSRSPTRSRPSGCSAARDRGGPRRRHARGDRRPARASTTSETEPVVEHYRATGKLVPLSTASGAIDEVWPRSRTRSQVRRRRADDHPQERSRDRADGAAGARRRRDARAIEERLEPGISMAELDALADDYIRSQAASRPRRATRAIPRRSASRRTTMIVHGIPGEYRAREGDIVTFDIGVTKDGYDRRLGATFARRRDRRARLSDCSTSARPRSTRASRPRGVGAGRRHLAAVQSVVEEAGFSVVRSLVGHGVGRYYHEDPQVPNFVSPAAARGCRGDDDRDRADDHRRRPRWSYEHDDDWSISTADGSLAAHFEHTVAITAGRPAHPHPAGRRARKSAG